jgi:hypothetical protein
MFNGLTDGISGLTAKATQVTVTVTVGATWLTRNVAVSYSTSVNTISCLVDRRAGTDRVSDVSGSRLEARWSALVSRLLECHVGDHAAADDFPTEISWKSAARCWLRRPSSVVRHKQ